MEQRSQIQFNWPPVTKSVIGLIIFFFVFWLATVIFEPLRTFAGTDMSVSLGAFSEGRFWSIFLYGIHHQSFTEILFIGLVVWMFGAELQQMIGLKRWWLIQISSVIFGGLIVIAWDALFGLSAPITGYHAAVMGLIAGFCWDKWDQTLNVFLFPLKGKTLLAAGIGLGVLMAVLSGHYARLGLDLAGVICGILITGNFLNPRDLKMRFRLWRARRKLKLVRGPEKKDYGPN